MKKTISFFLALAMMMSLVACAKDNGEEVKITVASEEEAITESTEEEVFEGDQKASDEDRNAAYQSYLEIIKSNKYMIQNYNWMNMGFEDSTWLHPEENVPLALMDLTGDGIEELLMMYAMDNCYAGLWVFSYDSHSKETRCVLNAQAGGGCGFVIAGLKDGRLLINTTAESESSYYSYEVYSASGLSSDPATPDTVFSVYKFYGDDFNDSQFEYKINDVTASEEEYNQKEAEVLGSIATLYQYSYVYLDQTVSAIKGLTTSAMTYDEMYALLSGGEAPETLEYTLAIIHESSVTDYDDTNAMGICQLMNLPLGDYGGGYDIYTIDATDRDSCFTLASELVRKGYTCIVFDIGDLEEFGHIRDELEVTYPEVQFLPYVQ